MGFASVFWGAIIFFIGLNQTVQADALRFPLEPFLSALNQSSNADHSKSRDVLTHELITQMDAGNIELVQTVIRRLGSNMAKFPQSTATIAILFRHLIPRSQGQIRQAMVNALKDVQASEAEFVAEAKRTGTSSRSPYSIHDLMQVASALREVQSQGQLYRPELSIDECRLAYGSL